MTTTNPTFQARMAARLADLSPAERRVAEYLRNNLRQVIFATAADIAAIAETSDATVVRTAKALGYSGLPELKHEVGLQVLTATQPTQRLVDRIDRADADPVWVLDHVFAEGLERLDETRRLVDEQAFTTAVASIAQAREVLAYGVGPSEFVARYAALSLTRIGLKARATGVTGFRLADELIPLQDQDVVLMYAPQRLLGHVEVLLAHAASVGTRVVLVSDPLGAAADADDRVHAVLAAVHSPGGFSGGILTAAAITDAVVLAIATREKARVETTSQRLAKLRQELVKAPPGPATRRRGRPR